MPLFGRRKESREPPQRGFAGDAAAMRAALSAMQAAGGRTGGEVDLRPVVRDLLEGEVAAPTADIGSLVKRQADPGEFYDKEIRPSWEGLSEAQRARRVEGFIELAAMLESAGSGDVAQEMGATVRTKALLLAWAFDETYGYLSRLARGDTEPADD